MSAVIENNMTTQSSTNETSIIAKTTNNTSTGEIPATENLTSKISTDGEPTKKDSNEATIKETPAEATTTLNNNSGIIATMNANEDRSAQEVTAPISQNRPAQAAEESPAANDTPQVAENNTPAPAPQVTENTTPTPALQVTENDAPAAPFHGPQNNAPATQMEAEQFIANLEAELFVADIPAAEVRAYTLLEVFPWLPNEADDIVHLDLENASTNVHPSTPEPHDAASEVTIHVILSSDEHGAQPRAPPNTRSASPSLNDKTSGHRPLPNPFPGIKRSASIKSVTSEINARGGVTYRIVVVLSRIRKWIKRKFPFRRAKNPTTGLSAQHYSRYQAIMARHNHLIEY